MGLLIDFSHIYINMELKAEDGQKENLEVTLLEAQQSSQNSSTHLAMTDDGTSVRTLQMAPLKDSHTL